MEVSEVSEVRAVSGAPRDVSAVVVREVFRMGSPAVIWAGEVAAACSSAVPGDIMAGARPGWGPERPGTRKGLSRPRFSAICCILRTCLSFSVSASFTTREEEAP